jgi:RNA polymerase sigma-70 factor, ECF subfamily
VAESSPAQSSSVDAQFRQFVAERWTALLRTAYLLAGDWATAEDLVQTTLTKTYIAWRRLGHIEVAEAYARRVLLNTSTSWWRRRWHGERPTAVLPERPCPDRVDEHVERDALWRHVRDLPARQRAVLVLRFYEDLTEVETARALGVSVGTVKSQASRALAGLRRKLSEEGIEPASRPPEGEGATGPGRQAKLAGRTGRSGPRSGGLDPAEPAPQAAVARSGGLAPVGAAGVKESRAS